MNGHGQGQADMWLIWEEACLTLDLLSLNHISRLSGFVMRGDIFAAQSEEKESDPQEHGCKLC